MDVFSKLNISVPIIEGGMTLVGDGHLAATVSNNEALGVIGTGKFDYEQTKQQIEIALKETDRPFGLNIMLENKFIDQIIKLVGDYRIPFVTLGGGDPSPYIQKLKSFGTIVYPVVPSVAAAKRMERIGADGVIAEGMESGGHVGSLTTLALVPQVVANVSVPVVAAGGIATGNSVLACLALGAAGVQIGTAFAVTNESPASSEFKQAIFKARDIDTVVTGTTVGASVRGIRNKYTKGFISAEMKKMQNPALRDEDVTILAEDSLRKAVVDGDTINGSIMSGQIAGLLNNPESVAELINRIESELRSADKSLQNILERVGV